MQVTVTGGTGYEAASLNYDAKDIAYAKAEALAATIDNAYASAVYYDGTKLSPQSGYLIIGSQWADGTVRARGFGAIVDENNHSASTVVGGGNKAGQIVLAGDGGLTFIALSGNTTVVAGGGDNNISFAGDAGTNAVYTSSGNDTIFGGDGRTTISAGGGQNQIYLGAGNTLVKDSGQDTVRLGAGNDTINVLAGGSVLVHGAQAVTGSGFTLTFIGGTNASTVQAGAGSYDINAGAGGGVFYGGAAGGNSIIGGAGSVTIVGGGANDTLLGGAGNDLVRAALGNETLGGGAGNNVFDLTIHSLNGIAGNGTTVTITDFNSHDLLNVGNSAAITYAINTYSVQSGNGTFLLDDGTKVVLQGFHDASLTKSEFK
jgi:Ca2+-binding RTX toxin-like protein